MPPRDLVGDFSVILYRGNSFERSACALASFGQVRYITNRTMKNAYLLDLKYAVHKNFILYSNILRFTAISEVFSDWKSDERVKTFKKSENSKWALHNIPLLYHENFSGARSSKRKLLSALAVRKGIPVRPVRPVRAEIF